MQKTKEDPLSFFYAYITAISFVYTWKCDFTVRTTFSCIWNLHNYL